MYKQTALPLVITNISNSKVYNPMEINIGTSERLNGDCYNIYEITLIANIIDIDHACAIWHKMTMAYPLSLKCSHAIKWKDNKQMP